MVLNRHNLRAFYARIKIMPIIKQLVVNSKEEYYHGEIRKSTQTG